MRSRVKKNTINWQRDTKKRAIKSVSSSTRDEMQKKEDRKLDTVLYKDNYCTLSMD